MSGGSMNLLLQLFSLLLLLRHDAVSAANKSALNLHQITDNFEVHSVRDAEHCFEIDNGSTATKWQQVMIEKPIKDYEIPIHIASVSDSEKVTKDEESASDSKTTKRLEFVLVTKFMVISSHDQSPVMVVPFEVQKENSDYGYFHSIDLKSQVRMGERSAKGEQEIQIFSYGNHLNKSGSVKYLGITNRDFYMTTTKIFETNNSNRSLLKNRYVISNGKKIPTALQFTKYSIARFESPTTVIHAERYTDGEGNINIPTDSPNETLLFAFKGDDFNVVYIPSRFETVSETEFLIESRFSNIIDKKIAQCKPAAKNGYSSCELKEFAKSKSPERTIISKNTFCSMHMNILNSTNKDTRKSVSIDGKFVESSRELVKFCDETQTAWAVSITIYNSAFEATSEHIVIPSPDKLLHEIECSSSKFLMNSQRIISCKFRFPPSLLFDSLIVIRSYPTKSRQMSLNCQIGRHLQNVFEAGAQVLTIQSSDHLDILIHGSEIPEWLRGSLQIVLNVKLRRDEAIAFELTGNVSDYEILTKNGVFAKTLIMILIMIILMFITAISFYCYLFENLWSKFLRRTTKFVMVGKIKAIFGMEINE
ncbi:MAG: hypothetical protein MHMPM18_000986 [Marteilia pararefringens]